MLSTGDAAPDFDLESTGGRRVSLRDLRGKRVVLYFYPKDDTPGCTREACDFRDSLARLTKGGVEVLGVSKDNLSSHDKFRQKYSLPFNLLSDPDNLVAKRYGAFGEKKLYGKAVIGTIRSTFVIDEQGKIMARWSSVKVPGHVDKVLAVLQGESGSEKPQRASTKKAAKRS